MLDKYIKIDHNESRSLQDQIKSGITLAIANGFISKKQPVTSSRKLSKTLKVSRNTVLRVYTQLVEDGFFISVERKGYFINPELELHNTPTQQHRTAELDWDNYLTHDTSIKSYHSLDLKCYPYLFVHGMVDETSFPVVEWRKCSIQSLNKSNHKFWTSSANDYQDLIEQIRTRVLPRRGIFAQADEILITMGSQQSLNLISRLLSPEKRRVGLENPGYPEAKRQFKIQGSQLVPLEIDDQGLVIDSGVDACDVVYCTPSNQFPTTVRLSPARREMLVKHAQEHDFLIVEDDFEHIVHFTEEDIPALKGQYASERIIYLSSFSSTIAPGLKIGFMVAAPAFIKQAKLLQQQNHSYPPKNNCQTLALFLSLGYYDALMQKLLKNLRSKWLTMEKALNFYFPQFEVLPSLCGTAFWINYGPDFDASHLTKLAEEKGILINFSEQYYFENHKCNGFRISFSSIDERNIREGIKQLSLLAKQILPPERINDASGKLLSGQEIRSLLKNNTLLTSDCFNIPYRITFQADGRMYGVSQRPNDDDEGYWWTEKGKMLYQWKTWQFADIREMSVLLDGNHINRFDSDGYCVSKGIIEPINAPSVNNHSTNMR